MEAFYRPSDETFENFLLRTLILVNEIYFWLASTFFDVESELLIYYLSITD
jgi:hypothetical protein